MFFDEEIEIIVDIQANAFVHHMVRNIVGSLAKWDVKINR